MTIDEKERQIEAAWAMLAEQKAVPVSEQKRPFRVDLPEKERSSFKRSLSDDTLSLNDREAAALALGWLVVPLRTSTVITTHKGLTFTLSGYREAE